MERFLIETSHRKQDCGKLAQGLHTQDVFSQFDWACAGGMHTGWAIVEANSETEARLKVPRLVGGQARVVKISELDVSRMHAAFPCWW